MSAQEQKSKPENEKQPSDDVVSARIVTRLREYIKNMDARISIMRTEIRERQSAVEQLEKEKWELEREVDKMEGWIG